MAWNWLDQIRTCSLCQLWSTTGSWLCLSCLGDLRARCNASSSLQVKDLPPVSYLWRWTPGDYKLGKLLHSLKGGANSGVWRKLVREEVRPLVPHRARHVVVVPIPSRNPKNRQDHAWRLAQALAELRGFEFEPNLIREPGSIEEQKRLTRKLRVRSTAFKWQPVSQPTKLPGVEASGKIHHVLVDDVITTGETMRAAVHAMGDHRRISIWCLACRVLDPLV